MSNRTCRYCGESGHNVRKCPGAKRTNSLIRQLEHRLVESAPSVAEACMPISSLEASMMHCELTPITGHQTISWNAKERASSLIKSAIMRVSENPQLDLEHILRSVSMEFDCDKNQTISYLITSESCKEKSANLTELLTNLNLDISTFIQSKFDGDGNNSYKRIWDTISGAQNRNEGAFSGYSGIEGNEGEIIKNFLESIMRNMKESAINKRTNSAGPIFDGLTCALGTRSRYSVANELEIGGEWFNGESPNINIHWTEFAHQDLTFDLTSKEEIRSEIESILKTAIEDEVYEDAIRCRLVNSRGWDSNVVGERVELMVNNHKDPLGKSNSESVRSCFFSSVSVTGDIFYEPNPPQQAIDNIVNGAKATNRSIDNATKDFIRMAHSGGYAQTFSGGKLQEYKSYSFSLDKNLGVSTKNYRGEEEALRWMNVAVRGGSVTLDDIVNSILDAYVNSSRKLL